MTYWEVLIKDDEMVDEKASEIKVVNESEFVKGEKSREAGEIEKTLNRKGDMRCTGEV